MELKGILSLIFLVIFFGIMIGVGIYCRRHATDVNGFVLGGRSVGPWLTAFAYGTSYFSAVIFIGYAGQFGWKYGIASTWIGIGNALIGSLLAWVILGRRTRIMTQHLNSATMPEFFGKRFDSKSLKIGASIITFIFLIPYTASLYNGLSRLFEMAFGIDYTWCIIIMSVLTGIYVIAGGYMATAINDFIQGLIMIVGIIAVIAAVLSQQGGFMEALNGLANVKDPTVTTPGAFNSFFGPDPFNLLISTAFAFIVAGGCYFLGGFGRLFNVDVEALGFDAIIPEMLKGLPDILIAIVVILVLSASMSTLSSLVIASSSTLTIDLLKGNIIKKMNQKKEVLIIRIFIVVFIAIAAVIAIYQAKSQNESVRFIAQLMGVSWGALAGAFLAPFLYGLYWKKTTKIACWVSFVFGAGIMLLNLFFRAAFPVVLQSPINCGAFAMLAGLVIVPVVSLITKKPDKQLVEESFACYEKKVPASQKNSLD